MHEIWQDFFAKNNFTINGSFTNGVVNGYRVNITPLKLHIAFFALPEQILNIEQEIKPILEEKITYEFDRYGIIVKTASIWTMEKTAKKTISILNKICDILKINGAVGDGYCPACGKKINETDVKKQDADGFLLFVDSECADIITEETTQPNNYLLGFIGAAIGGLCGAVIGIIIHLIGFYAGISSFIAFVLGVGLYKKLGGKADKRMVVIVTSTTFIMMLLSVFIMYLVIAGNAAAEENLEIGAMEAFKLCMNDMEFKSSFIIDMVMTFLFTVAGCVAEIIKTLRAIKRNRVF